MRFRLGKKKREIEIKVVHGVRFAWVPTKLSNGTWVWLEKYRIGVFQSASGRTDTNCVRSDKSPEDIHVVQFAERCDVH